MAFTLRTDSELEKALDALVASEGGSRQEVIRRAVLDRFDRSNRTARIDDVLAEQLPRYKEALDRLGQ
ncbi:ribbon-helix-helix protein, CopG family [Terracoccus luteus]|uniref:Putative transcriptional regulator n=1 Tax=Terracoccus luteus TaxID=53356 RepID=A0A839Q2B4_9MICO|nr:ribbon-helix-helix protein, CopG family [Terracoccus luteus]MBB2988406.1 putative transcriptional regulator [Terracoccus luteus]MCP2174067.1 putative transcriptional regulator [Terracoccus luteus]